MVITPLSYVGSVVTMIILSALWFMRVDLFIMRKQRPREVKCLAQSHTAWRAKAETHILSPDSRAPWCFCSPRFTPSPDCILPIHPEKFSECKAQTSSREVRSYYEPKQFGLVLRAGFESLMSQSEWRR